VRGATESDMEGSVCDDPTAGRTNDPWKVNRRLPWVPRVAYSASVGFF